MKECRSKIVLYVFIIVSLAFYVLFIVDDCFDLFSLKVNSLIKYLSLIPCLVYIFIGNSKENLKRKIPLILTAFLVLLADYFLLFKDENLYHIGIFTFIIIQYCYAFYVRKYRSFLPITLVGVLTSSVLVITLLIIKKDISLYFNDIFAVFYYSMLIYNIIRSYLEYKKSGTLNENRFFLLSLILLALCDLSIGLDNLIPSQGFIFIFSWLYYLPSRVALSIFCQKRY